MSNARALLPVLLCAMFAPATAAASVTLGPANPNPNPAGSQAVNWSTGSLIFTAAAPAGVQLTAPADGVITGWQLYTDDVGEEATAQLRTLAPKGAKSYAVTGAGAAESMPQVTPADADYHNIRHVFSARLPIAAGEIVGVSLARASASYVLPVLPAGVGWEYGCLGGPCASAVPTAGNSATASQVPGQWLALNAQFELDVDRDGLGDETQDLCVGVCQPLAPPAAAAATPVVKPTLKKRKKCGKGKKLKRGKCVKKHKKNKKHAKN